MLKTPSAFYSLVVNHPRLPLLVAAQFGACIALRQRWLDALRDANVIVVQNLGAESPGAGLPQMSQPIAHLLAALRICCVVCTYKYRGVDKNAFDLRHKLLLCGDWAQLAT